MRRRGGNRRHASRTPLRERVPALPPAAVRQDTLAALSRPELLAHALRRARSEEETIDALCRFLHIGPAAAMAVLNQLDELRRGIDVRRPVPHPRPMRRARPLMCPNTG